jgi:hypothetical protein
MKELMERLGIDGGAEPEAAGIFVDAILAKLVEDDPVDRISAVIGVLPGIGEAIPTTRCVCGGMLGVMGAGWRSI